MLYVTKGNQQFKIDADEKNKYAAMGYTVMDADGNVVKTEFHAPIPYEQHIKELEAAEAKIKELEAKIKELESDDFE